MAKQVQITITSAVVIAGEIAKPGQTVTLEEADAKNLLQRKKAQLTTQGADGEGALSSMTVAELRDIAAEHGIDGASKMNKADLVAAIEEAEAE